MKTPSTPLRSIGTAIAHTRCIGALKAIPVETVPPEQKHFAEQPVGDRLLIVDGLRPRLLAAYEGWSVLTYE